MTAETNDDVVASTERSVTIRCHELAPAIGELSANLATISSAIKAAAGEGIDLLVLPELATSGYYLTLEEARACAMTTDHPRWAEWASCLPAEMTVVIGFCEDREGILYNSAATVDSTGLLDVYRKTHLWDAEKNVFTEGSEAPRVIDTPAGRLGALICYDLEFPEMPRMLALEGAEIIAVPTNWPVVPKPAAEHPPEVIQAMAAARSSCVSIACCDRSGPERGGEWTQGTTVIGADGWRTGSRTGDHVDAVVQISDGRTRIGPRNDVLEDRRPDLYEGLR